MKIKFLGTRGEIKVSHPKYNKHSAILIDDELMFDLGEKNYLDYKPKRIFITHLHPDHAFFVTLPSKFKTPLFLPENFRSNLDVTVLKKTYSYRDYDITPVYTVHSRLVKSQGYLIEKSRQKIFYSGDVAWITVKERKKLKRLDLAITDASYIAYKGLIIKNGKTGQICGHTGIPDLVNLLKPYTKKIYLMHYGSWFYKDIKKAKEKVSLLAKKESVDIGMACDGLEIKI
ncbi:hypothetical protein C4569_00020 [Candidatus Parcubacteria bacterium]|nr:MAG: hypothetical protein C4569_00020 [Candidatus Parcubacteria bacterium]